MSAKYIKPGLYMVTCDGVRIPVIAHHACDALSIVARMLGIGDQVKVAA